ncbi:MAG: AbrB/MazE/SpoVT family DNA-binding domain-containing protein [Clostridia bacterium]|nr:AbrB/MazE/SpoVT family DNA-binding domain-containing protein [Clostridia bacterium]
MQSTGIVRRVDGLGRFVLPIELRRALGIDIGDPIEIFRDGETVILKKYEPSCIFCGEAGQVEDYKGKKICPACLAEIKKIKRR